MILDLEAVWCHWCHVMEETTYRDPEVVRQIREHFVAVRVDQDCWGQVFILRTFEFRDMKT